MFRTRDFLLLFSTIMFLLVAIGGTLLSRVGVEEQTASVLEFVADTPQEFSAEVYEPEELSREERLATMRQKIAEGTEEPWLAPEVAETTVEEEGDEEILAEEESTNIMLCSNHQRYQGPWVPQGVQFLEQEGALLVYREVSPASFPGPDTPVLAVQKEVLLQLPLRPTPLAQPACLDTDVVGIAQDGSLIRNSETGLYSVFGENTLIGYARDGFPIYGVSPEPTDSCGGALVGGGYRYYLSEQRETILNCFTAEPVSL